MPNPIYERLARIRESEPKATMLVEAVSRDLAETETALNEMRIGIAANVDMVGPPGRSHTETSYKLAYGRSPNNRKEFWLQVQEFRRYAKLTEWSMVSAYHWTEANDRVKVCCHGRLPALVSAIKTEADRMMELAEHASWVSDQFRDAFAALNI